MPYWDSTAVGGHCCTEAEEKQRGIELNTSLCDGNNKKMKIIERRWCSTLGRYVLLLSVIVYRWGTRILAAVEGANLQ